MVSRQVKRVSKMEAVNILDVSLSTVERMIKRGDLQVEQEDIGGRHRIWILLDEKEGDLQADNSGEQPAGYSPEMPGEKFTTSDREELVALRVQVKGLQDLSGFRAEQLKESELRFQLLMQQLELLTRALPAPPPEQKAAAGTKWGWWPWRSRSQ